MIVTSRAYQLPAVENQVKGDYVFRGPLTRRMTAEQFLDAICTLTGVWASKTPASKEIDLAALGFKARSHPRLAARRRPADARSAGRTASRS